MRAAELLRTPDGRTLHLWEGGAPDGPVVIFHHGCPDCRLIARTGDAAARAAGVRLVALNRPGYGASTPTASTHLSVADDTVLVADALRVDRFAVLGMSLGGAYALATAARHPGRVHAVGVVAAPGPIPDLDPPFHRDGLTDDQQEFLTRAAEGSVEDAVELLRPEFESWVGRMAIDDPDEAALARRWTDGLHPLDAAATAALPEGHHVASARESVRVSDGYLRDAAVTLRRWEFGLRDVVAPTWLWYGALDENAPARNGAWLAGQLQRSQFVVRPDTAHLGALMSYWDEILPLLRDG